MDTRKETFRELLERIRHLQEKMERIFEEADEEVDYVEVPLDVLREFAEISKVYIELRPRETESKEEKQLAEETLAQLRSLEAVLDRIEELAKQFKGEAETTTLDIEMIEIAPGIRQSKKKVDEIYKEIFKSMHVTP